MSAPPAPVSPVAPDSSSTGMEILPATLDPSVAPKTEEDAPSTPPRQPSPTPSPEQDEGELSRVAAVLSSPRGGGEDERLEKQVAREEIAAVQESKKALKERLKQVRDAQNAKISLDKANQLEARLKFLQEQAAVFAQFNTNAVSSSSSSTSPVKGAKGAKARGRMTEEEEDRELLAAGKKGVRATRLTVQPGCIKFGQMRPYQIEGLNWMISLYEQGINGILADEMGLGKTLQTISLLGYLKFERGVSGPHIVVVPKAVLTNWMREFKRWCPDLRVIHIHGTKEERHQQIKQDLIANTFDVCITTFEVLMIEKTAFLKFQWRYIVVDEAHRLKSETTQTSSIVRQLDTQFRLLVTGTPLQNNLHELWALLNFLLPEVFADASVFEDYFKAESLAEGEVVSKLHGILRPFMIRRLKADVEKSLPPKREIKLYTGLSEMQEYWYKTILNRDIAVLNQLGGPDRSRLQNILMQLRKVCNHPYLFQGAEPGPPYEDGPHIWENAGKLFLLDKLLTKLKANGDRVLVFSQMTRVLDVLEDYLRYKNYEYCRIDGSTKGEERDSEMDAFNAPNSSKFVFLLSTRAGGLGINLATANIVVLYDSDWNPQMDLQAQDRAHRIGQKKEVTVFRLVTEGTVEEKIVERAEKKLYLDAVVVQQGRLQQQNAALSKGELMAMVKFGAESIFRSGGAKITDEDIDIILERDAKRTDQTREKFQTDVQHNLANFKLDSEQNPDLLTADTTVSTDGQMNFINLPSRSRRGAALGAGEEENPESASGLTLTIPKPKGLTMYDYQLFDQPAIRALEDKEHEWAQRRRNHMAIIREVKLRERKERLEARRAANKSAGENENENDLEAPEVDDENLESTRLKKELETFTLSPEEKAEKERLIAEGFPKWTKKDKTTYLSIVERLGRADVDEVAKTMAAQLGKDEQECRRYHAQFWKKYKTMEGWEKMLDKVKKGERKIEHRRTITAILQRKFERSGSNPWLTMQFDYGQNKGKHFTDDEDRFIVCTLKDLGYGQWDALRQEIRKHWAFRFDWFFKSRGVLELQKRADTLVKLCEKEEEEEARLGGSAKKRATTRPANAPQAQAEQDGEDDEGGEGEAQHLAEEPARKKFKAGQ